MRFLTSPRGYSISNSQLLRRPTSWRPAFPVNSRKKWALLAFLFGLLLCLYAWNSNALLHIVAVSHLVQNRFINQAFFKAPELSSKDLHNTNLLLYWTPFYQNVAIGGFGRSPFSKCPVNNCVATNDRRHLQQARAILFHGVDVSMYDLPAVRPPHQLYLYYVYEAPPQLWMPLGELNAAFNITITYRRDSDIYIPYGRLEQLNRTTSTSQTSQPPTLPAAAEQEPSVAWVVSHCQTDARREDYVDELRRYIAVDEYGGCSGRPCAKEGSRDCYQHLARSHVFYLAFENALCRDYITEKFFDALRAGMIPIARGAARADYEAVAPADSFLHVDDFAGPRELAAYLRWLASNATALAQLREWRSHYQFRRGRVWCDICELISRRLEPGSAMVPDLRSWFIDDGWCHR